MFSTHLRTFKEICPLNFNGCIWKMKKRKKLLDVLVHRDYPRETVFRICDSRDETGRFYKIKTEFLLTQFHGI